MISSSQRPLRDNTQHSQQTNIHAPQEGFEPTISASQRPQTYALDRATTGTGTCYCISDYIIGQTGRTCYTCFIERDDSIKLTFVFFVFGATVPQWARASSLSRFLDHTQRRITVGRTPLDELTARRRDLYLTTHNTHNRQTTMLLRRDSNPRSQQASGRRPTP